MLVYGDRRRAVRVRDAVDRLASGLARCREDPPGIGRHARLVALLVEAGELAQALADLAPGRETGAEPPGARAAMDVCLGVARAVWTSHASGHARADLPDPARLDALAGAFLPREAEVLSPEGYRHHGVYPECWGEAALRSPGGPPARVVGVRSIGTSLSAMVAAAAGHTVPPVTVRPGGHPFARTVGPEPALRQLVAGAPAGATFAIVGEGPRLAGSSFAAVAEALEREGVPEERLRFFPSHLGPPGPAASEAVRTLWARARKEVVPFEELFASGEHPPIARWVEDLAGRAEGRLEDVGGGRWRALLFPDRSAWPAAEPSQERRKHLLRAGGRRFVLKFVGHGAVGERALARARIAAGAGLAPRVLGLRHGLLVSEWLDGAIPLPLARVDRTALVARAAEYLALRARRFPASRGDGAAPGDLARMARENLGDLLRGGALEALERSAGVLEREARPVEIDGRLDARDWLVLPDGRIVKADATGRGEGPELIGCQDVAWDVAGAKVELSLDERESEGLALALAARTGAALDREKLGFYEICYLAYRAGSATLASRALAATDPGEAARLERARDAYVVAARRAAAALPAGGQAAGLGPP